MYETPEELFIVAEVPGVDPASIDLAVTGNTLTLRGVKEAGDLPEAVVPVRERVFGAFHRQITLPNEVDLEHIAGRREPRRLESPAPEAERSQATNNPDSTFLISHSQDAGIQPHSLIRSSWFSLRHCAGQNRPTRFETTCGDRISCTWAVGTDSFLPGSPICGKLDSLRPLSQSAEFHDMEIDKIITYSAIGIAGLVLLIFLLDLAAGIFGRYIAMDVLFILGAGFLLWQGIETILELR